MLLHSPPYLFVSKVIRVLIIGFLLITVSMQYYNYHKSKFNCVESVPTHANDLQTEDGDGQSVPLCPIISPKLIGWTNLSAETMSSILEEDGNVVELRMKEAGLEAGGKYEPKECRSQQRVAIIVPVRDRRDHLTVFLRYMHPFLQRKQMSYVIIVVEQSEHFPFNRGMLMNIGFKEVQLFKEKYQCLILHDVDMLPEHDGNPYTCPEEGKPRQMAFSMNYFKNYTPVGEGFFGAVTAISTADFQRINGFSNAFWGWGGEDENLYHRVVSQKLTVVRPFEGRPLHSVRYMMQSHKRAVPSPGRLDVIKGGRGAFQTDGLVNLVKLYVFKVFPDNYTIRCGPVSIWCFGSIGLRGDCTFFQHFRSSFSGSLSGGAKLNS